jgi:predicted TIM-barrel fold metal-dependent hydrolase
MKRTLFLLGALAALSVTLLLCRAGAPDDPTLAVRRQADAWRAERRLIDLHQHVSYREAHLRRAVKIMDAVGVGLVVNLSGGTTTHAPGHPSEFERNKTLADKLFPGRFVHYMNLDYTGWDDADFSARAVRQVEEGHRLGAAGLKEYKRLGLYLRDQAGKLIRVDDSKLDPVWQRCGELGLPVSIHVADPQAFWLPYHAGNERWKELKDHPQWWFGDPAKFPPFEELLGALDRVIGRHPQTTFVCVHFANNSEDLDWVERSLDRHPNLMADLAARVPEIGRHPPAQVRRLFSKHQDRILFATDFQVYDRLTLGSGGSGPPPTDEDAVEFFTKHWRWLETNDRQFEHMTPIQGDWKIDAIGLPAPVLRKVYFDNARQLLVRSLPRPTIKAVRIGKELELDSGLGAAAWHNAPVARLEYTLKEGAARPGIATTARLLWSERYLYLGFQAPFSRLTCFEPAWLDRERAGLWDKDVVEAFIGTEPENPKRYTEYEVAPTGEKLDLLIGPQEKGLAWDSGFEAAVSVDQEAKVWTTVMRIPLTALSQTKPTVGTRWRLNLYRHDLAHRSFLAWSPTATPTAHTPDRFGVLVFGE